MPLPASPGRYTNAHFLFLGTGISKVSWFYFQLSITLSFSPALWEAYGSVECVLDLAINRQILEDIREQLASPEDLVLVNSTHSFISLVKNNYFVI